MTLMDMTPTVKSPLPSAAAAAVNDDDDDDSGALCPVIVRLREHATSRPATGND